MTVETTVKYNTVANHDVNSYSTTTTAALGLCASISQNIPRQANDDHHPMSPRICLPCKSRLFALCMFTFLAFFCLSFYSGVITPSPISSTSSLCYTSDFTPQSENPPKLTLPSLKSRLRFPRTRRRFPQCIIIGCKKGGTRALLEYLNIHPKIQTAVLEMHFFDNDEKYSLGLDWYRRHMPFSFPDQITLEKTPAYFITESVPARIHAMNESIKILLLVRDPVTRVISDYAQLYSNKQKKGKETESFEELVLNSDGEVNIDYKAIRISMYDVHFQNWLRYFSLDQIHIVDGDRLISDPITELKAAEKFLGLKHHISSDHIYFNKTKGFYCLKNETSERCLSESKGRRHPQVDQEVVSKLRRFYQAHNHRFYKMVNKNFGWPEE